MPIIVDEVVISVEVSNASAGGGASAPDTDKQALIAECVAQVLAILRQQQEP
jgi:hypothetical protein